MNEQMNIMIVDDEMVVRKSLLHWFTKMGQHVETASSGTDALQILFHTPVDLMFVDIKMPGMDGIQLLQRVKDAYPDISVIIITAYGSIESAVDAMKMGADDYLLKPFNPNQLSLLLEKVLHQKRLSTECSYLKGQLEKMTRFDNIIGESAPMMDIYRLIPEVAQSDAPVLLVGETGTGKELVARAIHAKSNRQQHPFLALNCGAIPDSLMESELFGYRKGAFTGASQHRKGLLDVVSGGTLFLDEVGEISAKMQIDLLRVLEEKKITSLGSRLPVDIDFRLISATRKDLGKAIELGTFRRDFFYRINVIQISLPPLRERKEDIPLLVQHFLTKYSQETCKRVDHISPGALALLKRYDWPGNVRELQNAIERAVVLAKSRTVGTAAFSFLPPAPRSPTGEKSLRQMERSHICKVLQECSWNITRAARILDIHRSTLHRKMKDFKLRKDSPQW